MQLLKKRTFNDYFSDTFAFIKENGAHFFKNYFILSSVPIVLFVLIYYFYFQSLMNFQSMSLGGPNLLEQYVNNNMALLIVALAVIFIVMTIFGIIQYSFTPIYMKLYLTKGTEFDYKDILNVMFKEKIGKIIVYFLFTMLISVPVFIVLGLATLILLITIVGWIIPVIVMGLWFNLALFTYLDGEKGIWESFQYAWKLIFKNFWKTVGAVTIFTIVIGFISFGVSMIMNLISGTATIAVGFDGYNSAIMIIMLITTAITQIVSIFLQMLMQTMNSIVYYGCVEDLENKSSLLEIDKIGLGE